MSTAISDMGQTLVDLLRDNLVPDPVPNADQVALLAPGEVNQPGSVLISLFLYSIMPAAEFRNELEIPGQAENGAGPSSPLDLYYLLTAFPRPNADPTQRTLESHLLLGAAMRVFFDNGVLTGSVLRGSLPREDEFRVTHQPMTVEDMTRIWGVFPQSVLRTSASYLVTPVRLLSLRTVGGTRVTARQSDVDRMVPKP